LGAPYAVVVQHVPRPDGIPVRPPGLGVVADPRVRQQVVVHVGVARRITVVAREDDPLAVAVDHVVVDGRVHGVRIELNAPIGVVIDQVPFDPRVGRRLDVDAVVVVGRRKLAAVMDAASGDQRVGGSSPWPRADEEADPGSVVGHVIARERRVVGVDRRTRKTVGVDTIKVKSADRDVVGASRDPEPADDGGALPRVARERDGRPRLTAVPDAHIFVVRPG